MLQLTSDPGTAPAPVSHPLIVVSPGPTRLTVGNMVELLCEAQRGSTPILYSFYLKGKILRNCSIPHGRATSFLFLVTSEQDAGNYSCEAENRVSREKAQHETLSLNGTSCSPTGSEPHTLAGVRPPSSLYLLPLSTEHGSLEEVDV